MQELYRLRPFSGLFNSRQRWSKTCMPEATATVHMRGFTRMSKPELFSSDGDPQKVKSAGRAIVEEGLAFFDARLGDAMVRATTRLGGH